MSLLVHEFVHSSPWKVAPFKPGCLVFCSDEWILPESETLTKLTKWLSILWKTKLRVIPNVSPQVQVGIKLGYKNTLSSCKLSLWNFPDSRNSEMPKGCAATPGQIDEDWVRERSIQPTRKVKKKTYPEKTKKNTHNFWKCHFWTGMFLLSQNAWESQNWGMFHQIRMVFLRLDLPHLPEIRPNCNRKKYILETEPLIFSGKISFGSFSMGISEYPIKIMGYVRSLKGKDSINYTMVPQSGQWYQVLDCQEVVYWRAVGAWRLPLHPSILCTMYGGSTQYTQRYLCRCACIHDDIYLQWYQCRCYIHKYLNPIWNASMIFRVGIVYVQSEGVRQKFGVCQSRPSIRPRNWCN